MIKLNKGQLVYLEEHNYRGNKSELQEAVIESVGRKYFYIDTFGKECPFFIDSLKNDGKGYTSKYFIWLSKKEYDDYQEYKRLRSSIQKYFDVYGDVDLPLESLREIDKIITNHLATK